MRSIAKPHSETNRQTLGMAVQRNVSRRRFCRNALTNAGLADSMDILLKKHVRTYQHAYSFRYWCFLCCSLGAICFEMGGWFSNRQKRWIQFPPKCGSTSVHASAHMLFYMGPRRIPKYWNRCKSRVHSSRPHAIARPEV